MAQTPDEARAARKDWHRRKAMNRRDAAQFTPQRLHHVETDILWTVLDVKLSALWGHAAESADREALHMASECFEIFKELQLRGTQLELFPEIT